MSGRRPDATKVWNFNDSFRSEGVGGNWTALPEHFKLNGYLTTGVGKLFHPGVPPNFDQPRSWSEVGPHGEPLPYLNAGKVNATDTPECKAKGKCCGVNLYGHGCTRGIVNDTFLLDQTVRNIAVDRLDEAMDNWKATGQPFFVGMGTHRPHLAWEFPIEFWDRMGAKIPEAAHQQWLATAPHLHWHECAEMANTYWDSTGFGVPPSPASFDGHQSLMRRAYYGCISYVDDLIGQLVARLDAFPGARENTVVSFTGDHGWSVGEHNVYCKMTNNEAGTRVPLIFRAPWVMSGATAGRKSGALSELVDLYPTLSELAGLELPTGAAGAYLGGTSLVPVMRGLVEQVKNMTLSQFPRCYQNNTHHTGAKPGDENNHTVSWESMSDCHWTDRTAFDFMGYKIRTEDWSLTAWQRWDGQRLRPIWGSDCGEGVADPEPGNGRVGCFELYSHIGDDGMAPAAYDDFENENLAHDPAHAQRLKDMRAMLQAEVERWITPNP